jgi:nucleotide-binding universal stress UspA family protein
MRLLIAYDGSEGADAALDNLGRAGLPERCEAVVLSVADAWLPSIDAAPDAAMRTAYQQLHRNTLEQVERCRRMAESASERLRHQFPRWQVRPEACADSPGWAVIRRAEGWDNQQRFDLVIVGATEKSALGRVLLGSVSQKVVTYSQCSVRVARPRAAAAGQNLRLVLGVDGSPSADAAVEAVKGRTWPAQTEIRVISVVDTMMLALSLAHPLTPVSSAHAAAESIAARAARNLRESGLAATSQVIEGQPGHELVRQAEHTAADCVFVGARGLSRIERILLGSVSSAVVMRAPCSVEVVRAAVS